MPLSQTEFTDKASARLYFKNKRALLCQNKKTELDARIAEHLEELVSAFDTVLLFSAVRGEICLDALAEKLLDMGKTVAFPISHTEDTRLEFKVISSLRELSEGAYGIPEPPKDNPTVGMLESAVCITPALAIDERGYRLGYGKGYYDRFLKSNPCRRVGVVYEEFFTPSLPHTEQDIPVDVIVTEKGAKIIR